MLWRRAKEIVERERSTNKEYLRKVFETHVLAPVIRLNLLWLCLNDVWQEIINIAFPSTAPAVSESWRNRSTLSFIFRALIAKTPNIRQMALSPMVISVRRTFPGKFAHAFSQNILTEAAGRLESAVMLLYSLWYSLQDLRDSFRKETHLMEASYCYL